MPTQITRAAIDDGLTTLQSAVAATGNGSSLDVKGWAVAVVQVTGSFTATVTFEVTLDGSTWVSAQAVNVATGATATTATAAADFLVSVAGFEYFRTRVTWTSGTSVTTKARATPFDSSVTNAAAGAETVTANQGSAGASAWPVKGAGTAGSADTGVVTVQGIASGTAQPISSAPTAGTPTHTADATVDNTAGGVSVLASNASRKAAFVQNVGTANMRVSVGGTPTTTTGLQLIPGAVLIIEGTPLYGCPTGAVKAIREGGTSTTASVLEVA